ncbi:MAG: epoxyqueuosine reductase [SAR202 cluster bacterium]|jgi:NAD-dependent dihydropyrimidine dehydrogenase PreA subunit|nr:epoxyqueuosine reductase [SAR202 cluster bacterium]MDP6664109.1 epoxyqueuosine reductase [SAR202 cluster bacterium]MDP6800811.1 epoxyqueuosine reductase [SAR202 cluster bacterium]|tara:strand:+ start:4044 stop:4991 length:948 start_codon:yes stop_codon:yes gene_type:complete
MSLAPTAAERLHADPAQYVEQEIKEFVRTSPENRLPFVDDYVMWREPLVKYADGDDPLFDQYKSIIAPTHLTPREALAQAYDKKPEDVYGRVSVISWILPAAEGTRKSNRAETEVPGRLWSHTRWYGEKFNETLRNHVAELLVGMGYMAAAPFMQSYFKTFANEKGPYSNWSERHAAYAAGHGTFSLSDGLITEVGIAHRVGSVVTDLELPASTRTATGPYANCLFDAGVNCRACIIRCPADAISEKGHDKIKCQQYLKDIGYSSEALKDGYVNETSVAGCGLCQTKVPCEFQNPINKLKRKERWQGVQMIPHMG